MAKQNRLKKNNEMTETKTKILYGKAQKNTTGVQAIPIPQCEDGGTCSFSAS